LALTGLTRTTADAVLKEFYLPGIRTIMNNELFLLSQVEQNTEDVEGRRAVLSINTGRNQGIGARAEGGALPTAGKQGYSEERVSLKYNYGRIEISGPVMRSMGSDRGSFTRAVQSETTGVVRDLKNDVNRQLYGDGTGLIGTLNAAASGNTGTLQTASANDTVKRQLQVGMFIDIGTTGNPVLTASNRKITSVNTAAGTFVFDGAAVAITAADRVTRAGSAGNEVTGLAAQIASSGILWNIDPANAPDWVSYVDSNAGTNRAVAESMYLKAQQEVNIRSGEEIDIWITSAGVQRATANLLTSLKRFPQPLELKGGYGALDMTATGQGRTGSNTVGLVFDKDCQTNTAWGITTKRFQHYVMSDWEFMDEDGAVLNRVPNTDAYEGTLFRYHELATDGRNAHAKIADLTEA
jgi:hypothetical protein